MKKIALAGLLFAAANANTNSSGFFLGLSGGILIGTKTYGGAMEKNQMVLPSTTSVGWNVGVDAGYKQAFSDLNGLKYYISYNYGASYGKGAGGDNNVIQVNANIQETLLVANIDYYHHLSKSLSAYVGVGLGYQAVNPIWKVADNNLFSASNFAIGGSGQGGLALPINVGVNYDFNQKHSLSLGAKLPVLSLDYRLKNVPTGYDVKTNATTSGDGSVKFRGYIVQISYHYKF
ncbi:outer membrane beta-barrel protein [Helicobacter mustelae]|uniref:Putative outer membrane protein n=1 Tax=Helicobacter mustelae (strain ATCC 43772 / CCUG 25715 / CIP 103759 / LMG 18044 / NCTC 12198 / R85-136P) TaxID=679897 RepID=D3UFW4_HELM1|nr:outer membrane beta-barrel protein [Helicobacter mustelae]CBG39385.1 Putative outer membrane protein [Helicobacter mustelae 12198]SQH70898.1 outer membrane protein [Helicobacter mustelae]STP12025.1 outer membrane protein [Helicobacter mustelae]